MVADAVLRYTFCHGRSTVRPGGIRARRLFAATSTPESRSNGLPLVLRADQTRMPLAWIRTWTVGTCAERLWRSCIRWASRIPPSTFRRSLWAPVIVDFFFFRLYKRGDKLERHRDRPACEVAVSLNIGQQPSNPWPLYVQGNVNCYSAQLSPGDALLYRGIDLLHWREPFQGNWLLQAFLVDRNGPYVDQRFDGRITLMRPNSTS